MTATTFYLSAFDDVNERFMTLGQLLALLEADEPGSESCTFHLRMLRQTFGAQFPFEERLMEECFYPLRQAQQTVHRDLAERLDAILAGDTDGRWLREEHSQFVSLLKRHVTVDDNELIRFVDAIDEPPEEAVTTREYRRREGERQGP